RVVDRDTARDELAVGLQRERPNAAELAGRSSRPAAASERRIELAVRREADEAEAQIVKLLAVRRSDAGGDDASIGLKHDRAGAIVQGAPERRSREPPFAEARIEVARRGARAAWPE